MIVIKTYAGLNLNELPLLGRGTQGKVYRIDLDRCIKVFKSRKVCSDELKTLMMAQNNLHFPKIYCAGTDYIIRECINGIELNKYLAKYPLTPDISSRIIELYESFMKVGYTRLDTALFHIFMTPQNDLKLIDTSKALKKKIEYPLLIISGLNELGHKEEFLDYVGHLRPDLYEKWMKYLRGGQ